jgi:hypothetical protein
MTTTATLTERDAVAVAAQVMIFALDETLASQRADGDVDLAVTGMSLLLADLKADTNIGDATFMMQTDWVAPRATGSPVDQRVFATLVRTAEVLDVLFGMVK